MKRKEYQDKYDHFSNLYLSSPSAKSRRLDPESLADQIQVERSLEEEKRKLAAAVNDERALVLYNPTDTPLFKSPTTTAADFTVVVDYDLIPGLKDHLLSVENPRMTMVKPTPKDQTTSHDVSDDSMAIVPWVASWAGPPEPDEVEMMDVEMDDGSATDGDGGTQPWQQQNQQHCFRPEFFHGNYTPVTL